MLAKDSINQYKNQIVNLAVIIFLVIVSTNIYKSQAQTIAGLVKRIEADTKKNTVLDDIKLSEQKMKNLRDLINNKDLSLSLSVLSSLASESGVKIVSLRPGAMVDQPLYVKYPFEVAIKASNYHAIGKFMGSLENHPDIFIVEYLTIDQKRQTTDEEVENYLGAGIRFSTVIVKDNPKKNDKKKP